MSDFHPGWFGGDEDAARLVDQLASVAHIWDDLIDRDKPVSNEIINRCFEMALVSIPANPFYKAYSTALQPLIYIGVLGYLTANEMEKTGDVYKLEIAHGLRYAVAHVAAFAVSITNPRENVIPLLAEVWKALMPERFEDYLKEHRHVA